MKRFSIILCMFVCFLLQVSAKTTYIPTYNNRLMLIENGEVDSMTNNTVSLSLPSKDNLITCTIAQQVVSPDLVREIKRAKNAAGWAMVAGVMSTAHEAISINNMNKWDKKGWAVFEYTFAREMSDATYAMAAESRAQAEDLKTLLINLEIRNNSAKEMIIADMDRGLTWFVLPSCVVHLPLLKDEECHLRISSCNPMDENVKYINALGSSTLEKYTIELETDVAWYVPISNKALKNLGYTTYKQEGYIKIDKETMKMSIVSEEEIKKLKGYFLAPIFPERYKPQ